MLDPQLIREQESAVRDMLNKRQDDVAMLDHFVKVDRAWRDALVELESLKHQQNQLTPKGKPSPEQLEQLKTLSEEVKAKKEALQPLEDAVQSAALQLPNMLQADTPVGKDETENPVVRTVGTPRDFDFTPKAHHDIGEALDILDFERAVKISGARFVINKGLGAKLERAVYNFMLDIHSNQHGYTEMLPPSLVNTKSLTGTAQLPKFEDDQFKVADTDFWLSPTAEVQLTNMYSDSIIPEEELPIRVTAFTPCFRKEAGSYGRDMAGIIRQHQFRKVELVHFTTPEQSQAEHEHLTASAEAILQALELPYQVVNLCSGDLGFGSSKTFDLEVWFPSQGKYREISSCSNFLDFQARRAMIRYRQKGTGKVSFLHTLNGSGLAVGRTVAAILENYQESDGSVTVPKALRPYLNVETIS